MIQLLTEILQLFGVTFVALIGLTEFQKKILTQKQLKQNQLDAQRFQNLRQNEILPQVGQHWGCA